MIEYGDNLSQMGSIFAAQMPIDATLRASTRLVVNAMLTRDLITEIATDLKKIAESEQRSQFADLQKEHGSEHRVTSRLPRPKSSSRRRL